MLTRNFGRLLLCLCVMSLLVGCTSDRQKPLRIGINPWPGFEFLYLAQEKGFLAEAGLDVRLLEFSASSDCHRAYEREQIDVITSAVPEILMLRERSSRPPQIVRAVDRSIGADIILAHPDTPNGTGLYGSRLATGSRIGIEYSMLGTYMLARGLEKNGLTLADVTTVRLDQDAMEEALLKRHVDAVVTYPPISIKILKKLNALPLFSSAEIPDEKVL